MPDQAAYLTTAGFFILAVAIVSLGIVAFGLCAGALAKRADERAAAHERFESDWEQIRSHFDR